MFKKNNNKLVLENNGVEYDFLNDLESYKKLIIYLTNPIEMMNVNLDIDSTLNDEEKQICKNYKEFLEDFIKQRNEKMSENEENNNMKKFSPSDF